MIIKLHGGLGNQLWQYAYGRARGFGIDDGNHDPKAQLATKDNLLPLLRPNGLYVTEDIQDPDSWPYPTVRFENEYGKAALAVYPE